jgi:hypothetical protein
LPTYRKHVGICPKRHDIDTASEEPKRPYVADMVCVVSATCRRHVVVSVVLEEKNPRHDADITSQDGNNTFFVFCVQYLHNALALSGAASANCWFLSKALALCISALKMLVLSCR